MTTKTTEKFPPVSIIVPNWNGGEKTMNCLESIFSMDYPTVEVIVIDNGSEDGSREKIKERFKKAAIIENSENLGCVKAINQGFKKARHEYILRLDNDVILDKQLLAELMKVMLKNKKIGVLIPKIYYKSNPRMLDDLGFSINLFTGKTDSTRIDKIDSGQFEKQSNVEMVPGSVLLTKKEVIEKAGMVSADYFLFFEDADWCIRVRKAGYDVTYTPSTKAWHDCNKKEMNPFKVRHYLRSKIIFMRKNTSFVNRIVFFPFLLLVYTPATLFKFISKEEIFLIRPFFSGLKEGLAHRITLP
ncbi:glycosyltransferase family 2 protein [Candidatus Pacearchaeota archaeon]|nr:glycosyltransferase family 2 protein [Candidatus Pacearchaeota archaeon]